MRPFIAGVLIAFGIILALDSSACAEGGCPPPRTIWETEYRPFRDREPLPAPDCAAVLAEAPPLAGLWDPRERNLSIAAEFGQAIEALNRAARHGDIRRERAERQRLNHLFACRWHDPRPGPQ